eukprot:TRINITY_DN3085_c1_g3_i1.p1 TRINITY_DN3085_c1_g3~~TRINITY_DN3085_c1_g3_i1.p1  ORF type:complete len:172 (-),score=75.86 TRINITY_DN3085_c1_g3_i1:24-539(-)
MKNKQDEYEDEYEDDDEELDNNKAQNSETSNIKLVKYFANKKSESKNKYITQLKLLPEYYYFELQLKFETKQRVRDAGQWKELVMQAIEQFAGISGLGSPIDLIRYNEKTQIGIVRIDANARQQFWAAITLFSSTNQINCCFRVLKNSAFLTTLNPNKSRFLNLASFQKIN